MTGCSKVSPACAHCYAERMARRLQAMGQPRYARGFEVTLHQETLERPLHWRKPRQVFVTSMGDLFHDDVPDEFIQRVFDVMRRTPKHLYLVLTKRSARMAAMSAPTTRGGSDICGRPAPPSGGCRWSRCSGRSIRSTSTASTGWSWAASPGRGRGRSRPTGPVRSATSAAEPASRSSSSSGAAGAGNAEDLCSTGWSGDRCPNGPLTLKLRLRVRNRTTAEGAGSSSRAAADRRPHAQACGRRSGPCGRRQRLVARRRRWALPCSSRRQRRLWDIRSSSFMAGAVMGSAYASALESSSTLRARICSSSCA